MADLSYITITTEEDYLRLAGIDLNTELKARLVDDIGDNNPAPRFIYSVETYLKDKIYNHNPLGVDVEILNDDYTFETEHQTKQFKKAVCYQISYILKNGSLNNANPFINGVILPRNEMEKIGLDINAENSLRVGGLWNLGRC